MMIAGRKILGKAPISGVRRAAEMLRRRQRALDLGEVGRPVAEAEHEAEPEHDPDPVGGQRVGDVVDGQAVPGVQAGCPSGLNALTVLQPVEPPIACSATRVSGSSAATMMKNCSTSL